MKIYTTAKELVEPTMYMIFNLIEAANGGVPLRELRVKVLEAYKPMMTVIDGHFGKSRVNMINRTFNSMIYSKVLEKSGYAIYNKETKEVYATEKGLKHFNKGTRIHQESLKVTAMQSLRELSKDSDSGRVSVSELFAKMVDAIKNFATKEELASVNAKNEPKYRQVMRNLVLRSILTKTGLVKYDGEKKEFAFLVKAMAA